MNDQIATDPAMRRTRRGAQIVSALLTILWIVLLTAYMVFLPVEGRGATVTYYVFVTPAPLMEPQLPNLLTIPLPHSSSSADLASAPDGTIWFTGIRTVGHIARDNSVRTIYVRSGVFGMTTDAHGTLWITGIETNEIDAVTLTGVVRTFAIPTSLCDPFGITVGPDGNLWFTERAAAKIGRVTPTGRFTEYPLRSADAAPEGITVGADGNLWFTEHTGVIGRITPDGTITEFPVPPQQHRQLPAGTSITLDTGPASITSRPDGALWFTYANTPTIGRITVDGKFSSYKLVSQYSGAVQIVAAGDGNVWFTDFGDQLLGRITPSGVVTEFSLPRVTPSPGHWLAGVERRSS